MTDKITKVENNKKSIIKTEGTGNQELLWWRTEILNTKIKNTTKTLITRPSQTPKKSNK